MCVSISGCRSHNDPGGDLRREAEEHSRVGSARPTLPLVTPHGPHRVRDGVPGQVHQARVRAAPGAAVQLHQHPQRPAAGESTSAARRARGLRTRQRNSLPQAALWRSSVLLCSPRVPNLITQQCR
jgi:hypothetical protein